MIGATQHRRSVALSGVGATALLLGLCCAAGLSACGGGSTSAASPSTMTSSPAAFSLVGDAIVNGGTLPAEYTCDGPGATVALSWSNAPAGTREFALLMSTLPGDGTTKWNWILYSISANVTSLARNATGVGVLGVGSDGPNAVYQPPCSQGPGAKVYTFTVYALSGPPPLSVTRVTGAVLTAALPAVTLASASLSVSYSRP